MGNNRSEPSGRTHGAALRVHDGSARMSVHTPRMRPVPDQFDREPLVLDLSELTRLLDAEYVEDRRTLANAPQVLDELGPTHYQWVKDRVTEMTAINTARFSLKPDR